MHLLKGNIGCGMLAMGDAFRNGGLLMAPILTVFIGTVCIYNNHILVRVYNIRRWKMTRRNKIRKRIKKKITQNNLYQLILYITYLSGLSFNKLYNDAWENHKRSILTFRRSIDKNRTLISEIKSLNTFRCSFTYFYNFYFHTI